MPPPSDSRLTRAECLMAAATLLSNNPMLVGKWSTNQWAAYVSNEVLQLANAIYEAQ